jgi:hypothetical protein
MQTMVTIRFTQDRVVQDGDRGTPHETRFSAGQVVDLAEASANHWLSRGAAERVLAAEEPAAPPAPSPSSVEAQPSLDLTSAPAGDEDGPATDVSAGDDDSGSSDEASADTSEANAEAGGPAGSEAQPGLDLGGAQPGEAENAGDAGAPGGGQSGASSKSERKPARAAAKGVKA